MPDIVITLGVIGVCAGIGIGIAKCADLIYDQHIAKFSKKEINDNTRKLLRARLVMQYMIMILMCVNTFSVLCIGPTQLTKVCYNVCKVSEDAANEMYILILRFGKRKITQEILLLPLDL